MDIKSFAAGFGILGLPILLGLLHGLSPCEHSWPILAPFAITAKTMKRLFYVSLMFCAGTTVACVLIGIAFGVVGDFIPMSWSAYMGAGTAGILIILGIILVFKPTWLHFDHEHEDDHGHDHEHIHDKGHSHQASKVHKEEHSHSSKHTHSKSHSHQEHSHDHDHKHSHSSDEGEKHAKGHSHNPGPAKPKKKKFKHGVYWGMFSLSFINMIIPCPTTVPMYTLALNSGSILNSMMIFLAYAVATTAVLLVLTYFLGKASQFLKKFNQEKYEILLTRVSGILIALFGIYMALVQFESFKHIKPDWIL